jgi:hypothetical protein
MFNSIAQYNIETWNAYRLTFEALPHAPKWAQERRYPASPAKMKLETVPAYPIAWRVLIDFGRIAETKFSWLGMGLRIWLALVASCRF